MKSDSLSEALRQLLKRRSVIERKIARIQRKARQNLRARLQALPAQFGFATAEELIQALKALPRPHHRSRVRRRGIRYEKRVRAQARKALRSGTPAQAIARELGPSLATINKWKREFGLTKQRRAKRRATGSGARIKTASRLNGHAEQAR